MRRIKAAASILFLIMLAACIKPFTPELGSGAVNQLVVSGKVTGTEGWQEISVSLSSPVEDALFIPVRGCEVNIKDDRGNIFAMEEEEAGFYRGWISQEYLVNGRAYIVSMVTPDGDRIESAYDTLIAGASLDSVYYAIEDIPTNDPSVFNTNMQFYTDLAGEMTDSRYYKWEIDETWEFHSAHAAEYYYDGRFHEVIPPDESKRICWTTQQVKNIYTLSTENLSQNTFVKFPLHAVDGHSPRLGILYSILVTQQSLSKDAFTFFDIVRENSGGFGGLYEKQPFSMKGNLVNLSHPEKDVLGYFYATNETSKRYFYSDIEGIELDFSNGCQEYGLPMSGWGGFKKWDYPVYYYFTEEGMLLILSDPCIDCRLRGGTVLKPDFWPN